MTLNSEWLDFIPNYANNIEEIVKFFKKKIVKIFFF